MAREDRSYDFTHLSIDTAEERILIHRDYLAHCLRWSHVCKFLMQRKRYATARILDIGCGREMPLAKLIYSNRMSGVQYCGVDINKLVPPEMVVTAARNGKMDVSILEETDAGLVNREDIPFVPNIITSFECFEHIRPLYAIRMLHNARKLISPDGDLFFSTPCWNGSAADNHINETTFEAMSAILVECGWHIERVYGTFASQSDYVPHLSSEEASIYNRLAEYYDSNLLAIMLAPLYPEFSRNALWHCKPGNNHPGTLGRIPQPWSQHPNYAEYLEYLHEPSNFS